MKKTSIKRFTRKCLKAGYKEQVCKNAWLFGKLPTPELKKMYKETFKGEKTFIWPHAIKQPKTLKRPKKSP